MDADINELSEEVRAEIVKLFNSGAFESIIMAIKQRVPNLLQKRLTFGLTFGVDSYSIDKDLPAARFPLAKISTGLTLSEDKSKEVSKMSEGDFGQEERERLLNLYKEGVRQPNYTLGFSLWTSFADKKIEVCTQCGGHGFILPKNDERQAKSDGAR